MIIFFRRYLSQILLVIILLLHALLLKKLIYFPYPELFIYPYLTNHGLKPYLQILDQHFPGLLFLPLNLDNLGINSPESARILSIAVVIVVHLLIFLIGKAIFKNSTKALAVNVLYLIWQPFFEGWVLWIDNFLPLLLLPAFYALIKKKYFWTGIFLGVAIVFKQTIIPLSIFVLIYLIWKTREQKAVFSYFLALILPVIFMFVYLVSIGVFGDFWYWTIVFNLTTYANSGRGTGPDLAHLLRVLFVFGTSIIIIKKIRELKVQLLLIFLGGALMGLLTRFDFVHFQPALPFAVLATVYGWEISKKGEKIVFGIIYGAVLVWWVGIFYKGHIGDRIVSFDPQTLEIAEKIKIYSRPGEKIFIFGAQPHLYQITNTLPAGNIFVFQFPWFLKAAEERILAGLIKDQPNIVISDKTVMFEGVKLTDFAKKLNQYINQNYQKIDQVKTADILKKR